MRHAAIVVLVLVLVLVCVGFVCAAGGQVLYLLLLLLLVCGGVVCALPCAHARLLTVRCLR